MKFSDRLFLLLLGFLIWTSISCSGQSSHKRFEGTKPYKTIGGEEFRIIPDSLSVDRKLGAARYKDGTIKVLRLDDQKILCELENSALIYSDDVILSKCALSPDNRKFVAEIYYPHRKYSEEDIYNLMEVWFWSIESGKLLK
jgi:hypothetical protein